MDKISEIIDIPPLGKITDPLMLKAYAEALKKKQQWQSNIDELIHEVLGLKGDQPINLSEIPSTEKICSEMARYIPENEKLSDLAIAMREE